MRNIIRALSIILLFLTVKAFAYNPAEGKVTATFGPYYTKTNFPTTRSGASPKIMNGFGLIALGDINSYGSLEIGTFVMPKLFFREEGGMVIVEQTQIVQITMGYRYWINPYFSTSLAFYSTYSMGNVGRLHNDFPPGQEIDTSARDITEYGFDFALQGDLWSSDKMAVSLETRYSPSVTSKRNEDSDHYGVLLGIRYLIQATKKVETKP